MIKRRDIRDVEGCWRGVIVNSQWLPQWLGTGPFPWFINSSSQSDSVVEKSVPNLEAYTQHYMGLNHRPQDPCTRKYGPAFSDIPPPVAQIFLVSLHLSTHHSTLGTWSRNNSDQSTQPEIDAMHSQQKGPPWWKENPHKKTRTISLLWVQSPLCSWIPCIQKIASAGKRKKKILCRSKLASVYAGRVSPSALALSLSSQRSLLH